MASIRIFMKANFKEQRIEFCKRTEKGNLSALDKLLNSP